MDGERLVNSSQKVRTLLIFTRILTPLNHRNVMLYFNCYVTISSGVQPKYYQRVTSPTRGPNTFEHCYMTIKGTEHYSNQAVLLLHGYQQNRKYEDAIRKVIRCWSKDTMSAYVTAFSWWTGPYSSTLFKKFRYQLGQCTLVQLHT